MTAKPCLGYESRSAAVLALKAQGLHTKEIAFRIGIPVSTVSALEHSAHRAKDQQKLGKVLDRGISLSQNTLTALRPHAARREITVDRMARLIVEQVLEGNLVDAVMDDADELQGRAYAS